MSNGDAVQTNDPSTIAIGQRYERKRDKLRCQVVEVYSDKFGMQIYLRYLDKARVRSAGDWSVNAEQLQRLYRKVSDV